MLLNYKVLNKTSTVEAKIPPGVALIGAPLEWEDTKEHLQEVKLCVLDTGCPEHRDIKVTESDVFIKDSYSTHKYDRKGHGTHVCGTVAADGDILGVAPGVPLYVGKVLNDKGGGNDKSIADGILWAIDKGVNIISMSLGGLAEMPFTYEAIKEAYKRNIFVVCAAGNEAMNEICYPARYPETVAVGAVDLNKRIANFSSYGDVDVCAAGVEVLSCWLDGRYATLQGTSMATPHIAGAAALFQAKALKRYGRLLTVQELRLLFDIYSEDIMAPGKDIFSGYGVFSFGRFEKQELPKLEMKLELDNREYYVNGVKKTMDTAPRLDGHGRTLVPVRFIAEEFGYDVGFIAPKTVTIKR